jgi:hypothetical protein
MERKFYTDDFEQLLKEKSDEFRMYPSKRVWHSIYNDLHPGRKWPSVAVSLVLIIALFILGYWNNNSTDTATATTNVPSQHNIAALRENNGKAGNHLFLSSYLDAAAPTGNRNTTTAQQPVFNFTNNIFVPAVAASIGSVNINIASQPAVKNNTSGNNVFENIAFANIWLSNSDIGINNSQKVIAPEIATFKSNGNNNDDLLAKTNVLKQGQGIKAATSGINKEKGAVIVTEPVKSDNEAEAIINDSNASVATLRTTPNTGAATAAAAGNETEKVAIEAKETANPVSATAKKTMSAEDRSWIEDYAFHNKSKRKKWQDRTTLELYITPSVNYGKLSNDPKYNMPATAPSLIGGADANKTVDHIPGLGLEAGFTLNYSLAKNLRVKAGIQANYTSYGINANETNHPVLTTLMLIDPNSGFPYMHSAPSTLANGAGPQPVTVHNKTYQVSVPIGFAIKISGNNKLEWFAGATVQPTFVMGGKAYLISADRKNYVIDASLIRKWNINTGFETYINYKFDGFTLQAGPQLRYQLLSTYYKKYTVNENLSNIGLKLGIVKTF